MKPVGPCQPLKAPAHLFSPACFHHSTLTQCHSPLRTVAQGPHSPMFGLGVGALVFECSWVGAPAGGSWVGSIGLGAGSGGEGRPGNTQK